MENFISYAITSVVGGGLGAAAIVWLAKAVIAERLKEAIKHEYSTQLESHKTDLGLKVQGLEHQFQENVQMMQHQNEVHQLRTSLFFEPQRAAFAELLDTITWVNEQWWREGSHEYEDFDEPVSLDNIHKVEAQYRKHRLFLDAECVMGMDLLLKCYYDSTNVYEDEGEKKPDAYVIAMGAYRDAAYIQPLLVELFQAKIGISSRGHSAPTLALLGTVRTLNNYIDQRIGLPVTGPLKAIDVRPAEAVALAKVNRKEVVARLQSLHVHLNTTSFFNPDLEAQVGRYLAALKELGTRTLLEWQLHPASDKPPSTGQVS